MSENRTNYRKNLKVSGTLVYDDIELPFFTKNVSLSGFQAYSAEAHPKFSALKAGDMVYVRLSELNMEGVVSVLRTSTDADGQFNFGFKFLNMRGVEGSELRYRVGDWDDEAEAEAQ